MLEVPILDAVERLVASSISPVRKYDRLVSDFGSNTTPGTVGHFLTRYVGIDPANNVSVQPVEGDTTGAVPRWMPVTGIWMLDFNTSVSGLLSVSYNPATNAFTTEDSIRRLTHYYEDENGFIWSCSNNAGYFGLWRRTSASAWTQVLSDAASGSTVCRWSTGALYYRSSSGNWYILSNGAATVSTDPAAGGYANWWQLANDLRSNALPGYYSEVGSYSLAKRNEPSYRDDSIAFDANSRDFFWIWNWPARTRKAVLNADVYNSVIKYSDFLTNQKRNHLIPVAGTDYALQINWAGDPGLATRTFARMNWAIINLATNQSQYLGVVDLPYIGQALSQIGNGIAQFLPRMARMQGNVLDLWHIGRTANTVGLDGGGLIKETYTLNLTV